MTRKGEKPAAPVRAVYGRVTWGAYDQIFTVDAADSQRFDCHDDTGTIVEVAAFDPERYKTSHPVRLTCAATGRFAVTTSLDAAFSRLAADELPENSSSEDDVVRQSHRDDGRYSYSLPFDQYPADVQAFMSRIYQTLSERASHVWRLLRWRSGAIGSHEIFQTILASEWSWDGQSTWNHLRVEGYARTSSRAIPRLDAPVVYSVQRLLTGGIAEPTSEELLREARAAHTANPRAGLLLGVAASEVGYKELVIDLVPEVQWFALNVPSPPLLRLLTNSLPELPVRQGVAAAPPRELRKVMQKAVEARNDLAHQGKFNRLDVDLYEVLDTVRLLLNQFAYYRGFTWVTPAW